MTSTHKADWVWPIRWDAARMEAPILANLPALAAHRELDRLSSVAWDVHRGEPGAEIRLQDAVRSLQKAVSWLAELARAVEVDPRRACGCHYAAGRAAPRESATESQGAGAMQISHGGYLDAGGLSVLLAVVSGVVGDEACDVVIGLAAAAIAAESALAEATPTRYAGRPSDVAILAGRGNVPVLPAPMQLLSGSLPGVPGLPGLGGSGGVGGIGGQKPPSSGDLIPGKNPWVTGKTPWEIIKPGRDPELVDHRPVTPPWLDPLDVIDRDGIRRLACLLELKKLLTPEPQPPRLPPGAPVVWTSGITSVSLVNPCGAAPRLKLRGGPFGATLPTGVSVVAPQWNAARKQVVCRPVDVLS